MNDGSPIRELAADAGGVRMRILRGGPERDPILFLHGGIPGVTLYGSGAHFWSSYLPLAARERYVVAPDLPGFGDTESHRPYRIEDMVRFGRGMMDAMRIGPCHVVGHDEGGLIAIAMALADPAALRSITVVASPTSAPAGDSAESPALANPPPPLWSRNAQAWALERLSYARHHIDAALLDRCVACAEAAPHRRALARNAEQIDVFGASAAKAKAQMYAFCRDANFPVPIQLVWGSADPASPVERGLALFHVVAERQPAAQFHVINRCGAFPFREEPEAFHAVLAAFHDGLAEQT